MWYDPRVYSSVVSVLGITHGVPAQYHALDRLQFLPEGARQDSHSGMLMNTTVRESKLVPRGTVVWNYRQIAVTSVGECKYVVAQLPTIDTITPDDLMSNLHLEGLDNLSTLPAGSLIQFFDPKTDAVRELILYLTAINDPCEIVRGRIEKRLGEGKAKGYEKASYLHRGVLAIVFKGGMIKVGDKVKITTPRFFIPE